jgi:hypothetical protein
MSKSKGFGTIEVILAIVVVGAIGAVGWFVINSKNQTNKSLENTSKSQSDPQKAEKKPQAQLTFKIDKAEVIKKTDTDQALFVDLTFTNSGDKDYDFKLTNLKVKNKSNSSLLESYIAYPELFRTSSLTPLKDQSITASESVSGFLQIPITSSTNLTDLSLVITYTDDSNNVNLSQTVTPATVDKQ